jgi:hypothetical protein
MVDWNSGVHVRETMRCLTINAILMLVLMLPAKAADGEGGCEKFAWPLARERAWFASPEISSISVGDHPTTVPKDAFGVRLQPASRSVFAILPERKPKTQAWFGGSIWFPVLGDGGIYQVTLSEDAWIDIVQDGRLARSVGHSGRKDCPGLRKSTSPVPENFDLRSCPKFARAR